MPELPDVEVFKQYLDATSLHQTIETVDLKGTEMLNGISGKKLKQRLLEKQFESSRRQGKFLFVELHDNGWLVLHFGMTGFLKYYKNPEKEPDHDRLCLGFSNGYHLAYDCRRKLGEIGYTEGPDKFIRERGMGPDAMSSELDLDAFRKILSRSRGSIKGALMNQNMIAGLGNVFTDEILFQAGIHPQSKANSIKAEALEALFQVMREDVLPTVIGRRADPSQFPAGYLIPHRERGGHCPKCGNALKRTKISGRTTYLCPNCQKSS
jgi:formamidopyrimidine-DNA glycosylase